MFSLGMVNPTFVTIFANLSYGSLSSSASTPMILMSSWPFYCSRQSASVKYEKVATSTPANFRLSSNSFAQRPQRNSWDKNFFGISQGSHTDVHAMNLRASYHCLQNRIIVMNDVILIQRWLNRDFYKVTVKLRIAIKADVDKHNENE